MLTPGSHAALSSVPKLPPAKKVDKTPATLEPTPMVKSTSPVPSSPPTSADDHSEMMTALSKRVSKSTIEGEGVYHAGQQSLEEVMMRYVAVSICSADLMMVRRW